MAGVYTMTKAQLEKEVEKLRAEKKELEDYKKEVAQTVVDCIDEYNLNICKDGLEDFFERIGAERPRKLWTFRLEFSAEVGDPEDDIDCIYSAFEQALDKLANDDEYNLSKPRHGFNLCFDDWFQT